MIFFVVVVFYSDALMVRRVGREKALPSSDAWQGLITFEITGCDLCCLVFDEKEEEVGHILSHNFF